MSKRFLLISIMCLAAITSGCISGRFQAGSDEVVSPHRFERKYCIERIDFSVDVGVNGVYPDHGRESINSPAANNMPWLAYRKDQRKFIYEVMRQMPDVFSESSDAERITLSCRIMEAKRSESHFPFVITLGFLFPMTDSFEYRCNVSVVKSSGNNLVLPAEYKTRLDYWLGEAWTLVCHFSHPPAIPGYSETCVFRHGDGSSAAKAEEAIMYRTFAKAVVCAIERDAEVSRCPAPASKPSSLEKLKSLRDSGVITQREFLEIIERSVEQPQ